LTGFKDLTVKKSDGVEGTLCAVREKMASTARLGSRKKLRAKAETRTEEQSKNVANLRGLSETPSSLKFRSEGDEIRDARPPSRACSGKHAVRRSY